MAADEREDRDLNTDPITGEPGAHPVGTGVGAAGGAVAGAAAGTIGGPVGSLVGGVIGAVVGGLAGRAAAEAVNPTAEEAHWRENYTREPYYEQGRSFDDYGPAYLHGVRGRMQSENDWEAAEPRLASEWSNARAGSSLSWDQARPASRAAWDRVDALRGGTGAMASDTAAVRASDLAADDAAMAGRMASGGVMSGGSDMVGAGVVREGDFDRRGTTGGAAGMVGGLQSAGNTEGDRKDVIDALQDLVECCKDGEYGFRESAERVESAELQSVLRQRADDCRRGADELNRELRQLGGKTEDGGSALGAMHRGWVSVRSAVSTYDDKAVLEECERGEDNAKARYMKALKKPLPEHVRQVVDRQYQGVLRNHDQVKQLRDRYRNQGQTMTSQGRTDSTMVAGASGSTMMPSGGTQGMGMMGSGTQNTGAAGMVGAAQSAGNMGGDVDDVIDALQDLVECCKDGEYGFRECAQQAKREDLKSLFLQRADECRRGAEELNEQIHQCGGEVKDSGSAMGAMHRGWVSVRSALTSHDDRAVLQECERGEDNAKARYAKALRQPMPAQVKQVVERQYQAVLRNHDQVRMLRDSTQ